MDGAGSVLDVDALPGQGNLPDAGLSRAGRVLTAADMLHASNTTLADLAAADNSYQLVPGELDLIHLSACQACVLLLVGPDSYLCICGTPCHLFNILFILFRDKP